MKNRRDFLKTLGLSGAVFLSGEAFSAESFVASRSKVKLRFIVASDGHYGQPKTEFDAMHDTLIGHVNKFAEKEKVDFCVINGDLFHDDPNLLPQVKQKLDQLKTPYYVTRGNHDRVPDSRWEEVWKMPLNHSFTTNWMRSELEKAKAQTNTFIFLHIPQIPWVEHCIDSPDLIKLFGEYKNIKAIFHGHIHSLDGLKMHNGIPYLFDAHFGGNWGTEYRGFRVVEVMKDNSILTYMMNPTVRILEEKI